jgi:hypothetical protein
LPPHWYTKVAELNRARLLYNIALTEFLRSEAAEGRIGCAGDCTVFCKCLSRQGSAFVKSEAFVQRAECRINLTLHYRLALHGEFRHILTSLLTDPLHANTYSYAHFVAAWFSVETLWEIRKGLYAVNVCLASTTSSYLSLGVTDNGFGQELDLGGGLAESLSGGYASKTIRDLLGARPWVPGRWEAIADQLTDKTPTQQALRFEVETSEHAVTELVQGRFALCDGAIYTELTNRPIHQEGAPSIGLRQSRISQILDLLEEALGNPEVRAKFGGPDSDLGQFFSYFYQLGVTSSGSVTENCASQNPDIGSLWVTLSEIFQIPFILALIPYQTEVWFWG